MDLNHNHRHPIIPLRDEDLPLDKVLKPRHPGKKLPTRNSSDSQCKDISMAPKLKPISKDHTQQSPKPTQVSSTDIVRQLIFNQSLKPNQIQQLMVRLKNIKSLKYEKLSEKIRQCLVQTIFSYNYPRFVSIMYAFNPMTISSHLIAAVFQGYVIGWERQAFKSLSYFIEFFKLYWQQIPTCLNKRYVKWMAERARENETIYLGLKKMVLEHVKQIIKKCNRQRSTENEKIIGLIVYFDLMGEVDSKQLMRIVPLEKINQYTDNENLPVYNELNTNNVKSQMQKNQQQKPSQNHQATQPQYKDMKIPPLVHTSILQLIRQNELKQIQKLIRTHKIPYTYYPQFVQKLQCKYLQYIDRTYQLYVIDELIYGKMNLVENFVDMCIKRKKYSYVEHFVHKYLLMGVKEPKEELIVLSPLVQNDVFGPTESHVLNKYSANHFSKLSDFNITEPNVVWIDSKTIHKKPHADYLINLLYLKEVGIDSESASAIHVFEKARLELIQLYDPEHNVVVLFDVRDFKNDKKKRVKKGDSQGNSEEKGIQEEKMQVKNEEKNKNMQNNLTQENKTPKGKSISQPIVLEQDNQQQPQPKSQDSSTNHTKQSQTQKGSQSQQKSWYKFTKVIENIFKKSTIFGHCLHADLADIIQQLSLPIKHTQVKFTDSQLQFKKYFPNETKSKLSYLTEKCFGKELSKYEQCSAWDMRPLRDAQRHYAALDAVLPYKLVKWMQSNKINNGNGMNSVQKK